METLITTRDVCAILGRTPKNACRIIPNLISKKYIGRMWLYEPWEVAELAAFFKKHPPRKGYPWGKYWAQWRKEKCGV